MDKVTDKISSFIAAAVLTPYFKGWDIIEWVGNGRTIALLGALPRPLGWLMGQFFIYLGFMVMGVGCILIAGLSALGRVLDRKLRGRDGNA